MSNGQRLIKKMIIITILVSSLLIANRILFPPKIEVCFNGQQDIGEEKIDCGGVCSKKCPPPNRPPEVTDINIEWIKYVQNGENNYDLIAKISNKNTSWGLASLGYRFLIYNNKNELIKSEDQITYIMPSGFVKNDKGKYIVYDNYSFKENIEKVDIELFDFNWKEIKDERELPDYNVDIIQIKNTYGELIEDGTGSYLVYGETKNTSRHNFRKVDIIVVIFDNRNEIIAVGKTEQETMAAGNGWEFRIFWNEPFSGAVDRIDYEAQTNIFNEYNFMKEYGTGEKYLVPR